jgi:UDP-glucose 4-epimerase
VQETSTTLIAGAGGHVGGRLFQHMVNSTNFVVRPTFRTAVTLPSWAQHVIPIIGDFGSATVREAGLRNIDSVVYLATRGYSSAQLATQGELQQEYATTLQFAAEAAQRGVKKFIFVSSIHVFGRELRGVVNDHTPPQPTTEYGLSRLSIEDDLLALGVRASMQVVVIRMTNTFGCPLFDRSAIWDLFVHDLCRQVVQTRAITLRTNGTQYRNVMALRDAVAALSQITSSHTITHGRYVLASRQTSQLRELAEWVQRQAQLTLGISPTVEVNKDDMTTHHAFSLDSSGLTTLGITIPEQRDNELQDLLQFAAREYSR